MAARVVYDGTGSGGTLFEGKSFWVAQRVPSRSRWLELLRANGGTVVNLEKLADIMIADHAHKSAPPGSYSWKWIEESVKNGKLVDLESHRAGQIPGTSRPVGSTQPARNTRTPFTDADDRALALWVTKAERQGLSIKGNEIYQQLERINPRHTFQSWRDRWVKYVQHQNRKDMTSSPTGSGPVPAQPLATRTKPTPNGSAAKSAPPQDVKPLSRPQVLSRPVPSPIKPSEGKPFTEAEGKTLMDMYDDILNIDESKLFEAWEKFAEKNPRHTAQEWYKFWIDEIKPRRASRKKKTKKRKHEVPAPQSKKGESSQISETNAEDGYVQPPEAERSPIYQERPRELPTEKERFEHILAQFAEGRGVEIDLRPIVSGKRISLFDVWTIVLRTGFDSSTDDQANSKWNQIAFELGFEKFREPDASIELQNLYELTLADFADGRSQYRAILQDILNHGDQLTEKQMLDYEYLTPAGYEEEDRIIMQQLQEESEDEPEIIEWPSSPPQRTWPSSTKHGSPNPIGKGNEKISWRQPNLNPYKRQRVEKGKGRLLEIPSTPENLLMFDGQSHATSPVGGSALRHEQETEPETSDDDDNSMFVKPVVRKIFSKTDGRTGKKVQFEPETQDFHFSNTVEEQIATQLSQLGKEDPMVAGESVAAIAGSPREDSSTQSQTDSQREAEEVQEFVDHYVSLGYPQEIVQQAMLATTMETGDVAIVMEALLQDQMIPDNIEGVWTAEDDRAVTLNEESEEYARVLLKHKEARCVKRRQFLSQTEGLKND